MPWNRRLPAIPYRMVRRFLLTESGLTITEYAVAAGLIAATLAVTLANLGLTIDAVILSVVAFM